MASNHKERSYWPYMILGFLAIGIILGYWTIKSAVNMPVSESNNFQEKYQHVDMSINEILKAKDLFDDKYHIIVLDFIKSDFRLKSNIKRKHSAALELSKENRFRYRILTKDGESVSDANITFLLTRPHTVKDDQKFEQLDVSDGIYTTPVIKLSKPGRYILSLRVQKGNAVGYLEYEGYLKP